MTMVARGGVSGNWRVASHAERLKGRLEALRGEADATVAALHTIRARTSKVLEATAAFSAVSAEAAALRSPLERPARAARLELDADGRLALQLDLGQLLDRLERYRRTYAAELAQVPARSPPPPPKARRHWWHVFR